MCSIANSSGKDEELNLAQIRGVVEQAKGFGVKQVVLTGGEPCIREDLPDIVQSIRNNAMSCVITTNGTLMDEKMIEELRSSGFKINLWEHAYVHPTSPLFEPMRPHSGDFLVWGGLVVDFADPEAFRLYADYHDKQLVSQGIQGFKLDECDNEPVSHASPFNYPYCSIFPSGIDGDQMTQLYGYYYQRCLFSIFKNRNERTWGDVRATTALAAP